MTMRSFLDKENQMTRIRLSFDLLRQVHKDFLHQQFELLDNPLVNQFEFHVFHRSPVHVPDGSFDLCKSHHHLKQTISEPYFCFSDLTSIEIDFFRWTTSMLLWFMIKKVIFLSNRASSKTSKHLFQSH